MFMSKIFILGSGLALLCTLLTGCVPAEPEPAAKTTLISNQPLIGTIRATPADYKEKALMLKANFRGWNGTCQGPPPVARGDWMVEDDSGCIYVHGPLPAGFDPVRPTNQPLQLRGHIQIDHTGQPYFELESVVPAKGIPALPRKKSAS
jgi:hypothetical protein